MIEPYETIERQEKLIRLIDDTSDSIKSIQESLSGLRDFLTTDCNINVSAEELDSLIVRTSTLLSDFEEWSCRIIDHTSIRVWRYPQSNL